MKTLNVEGDDENVDMQAIQSGNSLQSRIRTQSESHELAVQCNGSKGPTIDSGKSPKVSRRYILKRPPCTSKVILTYAIAILVLRGTQ